MTPQQMHIEAAKKVIHELLDDPSAISIRGILTPMVARALAEAENRAAWDGFERGREYQRSDATHEETAILRGMDDKYGGPRPTMEVK